MHRMSAHEACCLAHLAWSVRSPGVTGTLYNSTNNCKEYEKQQ